MRASALRNGLGAFTVVRQLFAGHVWACCLLVLSAGCASDSDDLVVPATSSIQLEGQWGASFFNYRVLNPAGHCLDRVLETTVRNSSSGADATFTQTGTMLTGTIRDLDLGTICAYQGNVVQDRNEVAELSLVSCSPACVSVTVTEADGSVACEMEVCGRTATFSGVAFEGGRIVSGPYEASWDVRGATPDLDGVVTVNGLLTLQR